MVHHRFFRAPDAGLCLPHDGLTFRHVLCGFRLPRKAPPGVFRLGFRVKAVRFRRRSPMITFGGCYPVCRPFRLKLAAHTIQAPQQQYAGKRGDKDRYPRPGHSRTSSFMPGPQPALI